MNGPAKAIIKRCHRGLESNERGWLTLSSVGCSPAILTYPPKRMSENR